MRRPPAVRAIGIPAIQAKPVLGRIAPPTRYGPQPAQPKSAPIARAAAPPPPTRFGTHAAQAKPALTARVAPAPPPTRFGPRTAAQARPLAAAALPRAAVLQRAQASVAPAQQQLPAAPPGQPAAQGRRNIAAPNPNAITVPALRDLLAAIDDQLSQQNDLDQEVQNNFLDRKGVLAWRNTGRDSLQELIDVQLQPASYTWDQIKRAARENVDIELYLFKAAALPLLQARSALNGSLEKQVKQENDLLTEQASQQQQKAVKAKAEKAKAKEDEPDWGVGKYDKARGGAVVLVEKPYVVVIERYQLKHNPDLKVLYADGAWGGAKGSQLSGGWDAHKNTYAKQVLEFAKVAAAGAKQDKIILEKRRTNDIEAYITLVREGDYWIVYYHGNPPD